MRARIRLARLDRYPSAKGKTSTAEMRLAMQKAMQEDAAVFRTGETLDKGRKRIDAIYKNLGDIGVTDRSLIWNTDLVETLEFENLIQQAVVAIEAPSPAPKAAARMPARIIPIATTRIG